MGFTDYHGNAPEHDSRTIAVGRVRPPDPALLFIGTLYCDESVFHDAYALLKKHSGEILLVSHSIPWDFSTYYHDEIGSPLLRQFLFFKTFIDPGTLADIKIKTNGIEDVLSSEGKRRINLDPGYLTLSKIVLASTKDYAHRIYLGKGIYAETTLIYKGSTYEPHMFSYRDYQEESYIKIFMNVRALYKKMLS
jgi:hypothetical protein